MEYSRGVRIATCALALADFAFGAQTDGVSRTDGIGITQISKKTEASSKTNTHRINLKNIHVKGWLPGRDQFAPSDILTSSKGPWQGYVAFFSPEDLNPKDQLGRNQIRTVALTLKEIARNKQKFILVVTNGDEKAAKDLRSKLNITNSIGYHCNTAVTHKLKTPLILEFLNGQSIEVSSPTLEEHKLEPCRQPQNPFDLDEYCNIPSGLNLSEEEKEMIRTYKLHGSIAALSPELQVAAWKGDLLAYEEILRLEFPDPPFNSIPKNELYVLETLRGEEPFNQLSPSDIVEMGYYLFGTGAPPLISTLEQEAPELETTPAVSSNDIHEQIFGSMFQQRGSGRYPELEEAARKGYQLELDPHRLLEEVIIGLDILLDNPDPPPATLMQARRGICVLARDVESYDEDLKQQIEAEMMDRIDFMTDSTHIIFAAIILNEIGGVGADKVRMLVNQGHLPLYLMPIERSP